MKQAKSHLDAAMDDKDVRGTELAEALEVSPGQVSRWRNNLTPSKDQRERIAKYLGMNVEQLWP